MQCSRARRLATRRLREALPAAEETGLDAHLAACPACREEAVKLQRLEAVLQQCSAARPAVTEPVRVETAAILRTGRPRAPRSRWVGVALAGAAGAAVVTGLLLLPQRSRVQVRRSETHGRPGLRPATVPERREAPVARNSHQPGRTAAAPPERVRAAAPPAVHASGQRPRRVAVGRYRGEGPLRVPERAREGAREPGLEPRSDEAPLLPALSGADEGEQVVALIQNAPPADGLAVTEGERKRQSLSEALLRADPRLAARVTVGEKNRLLSEWLPRLGKTLKVPLLTTRDLADDKVTFFARERPAAETMIRVARLFGFIWRRTESGYELAQEPAARQREERFRQRDLDPIRADVAENVRLAALTTDQHKARVEELDRRLKAGNLSPTEQRRLTNEKQAHLNAWLSPDALGAALALFRSLSARQGAELLAGAELRFSTGDGTLPAPIADKVHDSTRVLELQYGALTRVQADVTVQLLDVENEDDIPPPRRNRGLRLRFAYATVRGPKEDRHYFGGGWSFPFPGMEAPAGEAGDAPKPDPRLEQAVELVLPGPERQPLPISGGSPVLLACTGAVWPQQATLGDVAEAVYRATGLEVAADSFTAARLDPARLRGRKPLREVLETVARELDYDWKLEGSLLRFRSRRYHWDRPAEAPERVIRPFQAQVLRKGEVTLDELATLAAGLTDPQARSLYRYWGWYLENTGIVPTGYFYAHRQHLRLWAGLTGVQKQSLLRGEVLPVGQMTPAQQARWTAAFISPPENHRTPASELRAPSAAEVLAGGFSLQKAQTQQLLFSQVVDNGEGGKKRVATSISVEGPPTLDARKFLHSDVEMETLLPQLSLDRYRFSYHLGGNAGPARSTDLDIAPLQRKGGK